MIVGNAKTRDLLVKVATMYYIGNQSQDEIAKSLSFSRTKVSRLLDFARKTKVIEFKIKHSESMMEEWASRIKEFYGLKDVLVVPSATSPDESKLHVGKAAAGYLDQLLVNDINIGFAWGTTINEMVRQFLPSRTVSNAWVVQLNGGMNIESDSFHMDGTELVKTVARKINAFSSVLPAQYIVKNRLLRKLLMEEDEIRKHFAKFDSLDVAVVGLTSSLAEENVAYRAGYITLDEANEMIRSGFVTDICGNPVATDGEEKENPLTGRVLAIDLQTLKKVPLVIAIGEGERKAAPTIAALRGHYVNALIIDELLALAIMCAENIDSK